MTKVRSNVNKEYIWSIFTVEQLAVAIASLGSRINELEDETWCLNDATELPISLWYEAVFPITRLHSKTKVYSTRAICRVHFDLHFA